MQFASKWIVAKSLNRKEFASIILMQFAAKCIAAKKRNAKRMIINETHAATIILG